MKRYRIDSQRSAERGDGGTGTPIKQDTPSSGEEASPVVAPRKMATLRERYRLNDDDESALPATYEQSRLLSRDKLAPIPIPSGVASSAIDEPADRADWHPSSSSMKRRRSRSESPTRPRSQKGSAESLIASTRKVDEDIASSSRRRSPSASRTRETQESTSGPTYTSQSIGPRKVARLSSVATMEADGAPARVEIPFKRPSSRVSESESTSVASSTRLRAPHSRGSSFDEAAAARAREETAPRPPGRSQDEEYYTWQSSAPVYEPSRPPTLPPDRGSKHEAAASESTDLARRLPPLRTDVQRATGPGSAPVFSGYPSSHRSRSSSPSRNPVLTTRRAEDAIRPYGESARGSADYYGQRAPRVDPTGHYSQFPPRRSPSYDLESVSEDTPRYGAQVSGIPGQSPSLQGSQTVPGQAFIHPSLAGLPGTGGGAGSKQQPSFVSKLYSMLEDETISDMISWGPSGTTFSVANPAEFAKLVLPNWFKHSNWQSFVRQLNMYGFHKVNHTYQGTPEDEIQIWEFRHPNFRRGEVQLLSEIKRKSSRHKRQDSITRGMVGAPEFEFSGTPSPELGMSHIRLHGMGGSSTAPPPGTYSSVPAGMPQQQAGPSSHPMQSDLPRQIPSSSASGYYREFPPASASSSAARMSAQSSVARGVPTPHPGYSGTDNVSVRFDEVSERIDAVIRHATFFENEMRAMKEHVYTLQQNESSLRAHVHHLEAQMRSLSDQLSRQQQHQQQHQSQQVQQQSQSRLPPPPTYHQQQLQQSQQPQQRAPSPSPSLRSREGHVSLAPPPPPSVGGGAAYSGRSPSLAHPSFPPGGSRSLPQMSVGHPTSAMASPSPSMAGETYPQRLPARPSSTAGPSGGPSAGTHSRQQPPI